MQWLRISVMVLSTAFYGCAVNSNASSQLNATVINHQSFDLCPVYSQTKAVTVIKTKPNWQRLLQKPIAGMQGIDQWQPDFEKQILVIYQIGMRRSLGYKPQLVRAEATDTTAVDLVIKQNRPANGSMQAAVVSQPCLMVLMANNPKVNPPKIIRITDLDTGTVVGQTTGLEQEAVF
jgi:hypothetical protein